MKYTNFLTIIFLLSSHFSIASNLDLIGNVITKRFSKDKIVINCLNRDEHGKCIQSQALLLKGRNNEISTSGLILENERFFADKLRGLTIYKTKDYGINRIFSGTIYSLLFISYLFASDSDSVIGIPHKAIAVIITPMLLPTTFFIDLLISPISIIVQTSKAIKYKKHSHGKIKDLSLFNYAYNKNYELKVSRSTFENIKKTFEL